MVTPLGGGDKPIHSGRARNRHSRAGAQVRSLAEQNAAADLAARRRLQPTRSWGEAQMLAQLAGASWADTNVLLCPAPRGAAEPPEPPLGAWEGEAVGA